jgi:hypothetical protein
MLDHRGYNRAGNANVVQINDFFRAQIERAG